jgi:hypothetical protein
METGRVFIGKPGAKSIPVNYENKDAEVFKIYYKKHADSEWIELPGLHEKSLLPVYINDLEYGESYDVKVVGYEYKGDRDTDTVIREEIKTGSRQGPEYDFDI